MTYINCETSLHPMFAKKFFGALWRSHCSMEVPQVFFVVVGSMLWEFRVFDTRRWSSGTIPVPDWTGIV